VIGAILVGFIIALNGLLAASNNAFVNSHPLKLKQRQEEGRIGATWAIEIAQDATPLILSMRIARWFCRFLALGLAMFIFLPRYFDLNGLNETAFLSFFLMFGLIIGLTEFFAENLVMRAPEKWAAWSAFFARIVIWALTPITWTASRIGRLLRGSSGSANPALITEEEIMTMVDAGEEGGVIEKDEKAMIYSIIQLGDTLAREVMIPRIDILALEEKTSVHEATDILLQTGHSRAPVFAETIDQIIGLIYIKDLLEAWRKDLRDQAIQSLIREAYYIPEAMKLDDLLSEMQAKRVHMAIVVDEYGGTAGLVTIEDIVEEIVGEIRDEFDIGEEAPFQRIRDGEYLFSGGIDLDDVNQITGSRLLKDTSETLGGFIYSHLGHIPVHGEVVETGELELTVEQVVGRRIRQVRAVRKPSLSNGVEMNEADKAGNR
jgi:putative hemolysin